MVETNAFISKLCQQIHRIFQRLPVISNNPINATFVFIFRMASGSYYVPTIQHLQFAAKDGRATNGKFIVTERSSGFINLAQHKVK